MNQECSSAICEIMWLVTLLLTGVCSGGCKCYRKQSDRNASSRTDMLVRICWQKRVSCQLYSLHFYLFFSGTFHLSRTIHPSRTYQNVSPQRNVSPQQNIPEHFTSAERTPCCAPPHRLSHPDPWPQHTRMHTPSAVQGETTPLYGLRYIQITFGSTTVPAHETPLVC
jgi:hypothetical protein